MPTEAKSISIREFRFPDDQRSWRLDWLAGVELSPTISSEPLIRVVLRPLKESISSGRGSLQDIEIRESKVVGVGVGQLPFLRVGSIWRSGNLTENREGLPVVLRRVMIDDGTVVSSGSSQGAFEQLIHPRFCGHWGMARPHLLLVRLNAAVQIDGRDYWEVLFPTIEVARFYYGRSTRLAHAVFSGAFQDGFGKVLNDDETSQNLSTGDAFIKLRAIFSNGDAWTIARIRFSADAFKGARLIWDSVLRDAANDLVPRPRTNFPFVGETDLGVHAKVVQGEDGNWRLLVFTIDSCSGPFPYSELTVDRDNDGRKGDSEPDGEEILGWMTKYSPVPNPDDHTEINSEEGENKKTSPKHVDAPTSELLALTGKKIHRPQKDRTYYRHGDWQLLNSSEIDGLSTGTDGGSQSKNGLLLVGDPKESEDSDTDRVPALFGGPENLRGLSEAFKDLPRCVVSVRESVVGKTKFLPLTSPPDRAQWAYLDSAKKSGRKVLVVDLKKGNRHVILVEFQWRRGERACLGVVARWDGTLVTNDQLGAVLMPLSQYEGNWDIVNRAIGDVLHIDGFRHTWETFQVGAGRVLERLEKEGFL